MSLRYKTAFLASKSSTLALKVFKKNGTNFPGIVAQKIMPDYIKEINMPQNSIVVTGTNGKTTTSNIILNVLSAHFKTEIGNNGAGSNIMSGIITSLNKNLTLTNKKKTDTFVLEVDERYVPQIIPYVKPQILTITNLYQDSFPRNAHTDFIKNILDSNIPKDTKLVLNGDDLISSQIGQNHQKVTFGINLLEGEVESKHSRLKDIHYCPNCGTKLTWDFVRYHHIGRAHCEQCGFKNKEIDYCVISRDVEKMTFTILEKGQEVVVPLILNTIETIYNQVAAYASLREFGLSQEAIVKAFEKIEIIKSRYNFQSVYDRDIYMISAKNMNPIANSRVMQSVVENKKNPHPKTVIFCNDNSNPGTKYSEIMCWIYDADFEYLNTDEVDKVIFYNWKHQDMVVRCLLGGFNEEKVFGTNTFSEIFDAIDFNGQGDFFILNDIENGSVQEALAIKAEIVKRLEEKNASR